MASSLWDRDEFVDAGDMDVDARTVLIALVRRMFVTKRDREWELMSTCDMGLVRRDLSNLGLALVVDDRLGVAWAEQVPSDIRGDVPACRREARPERGEVAHAALCLRRHWDVCESRGESDPHVTEDELRSFVASGPAGASLSGDGEALERVVRSVRERLERLGLVRLDRDAGTWRILPTLLVLVNDDLCRAVAGPVPDEPSKGE